MTAPWWEAEGVTLYLGDCVEVMASLPEASVDAVVTDPPYGIGFMGREWDTFAPLSIERAITLHDRKNTIATDQKSGRGVTSPSASASMVAGKGYDRSPAGLERFERWCEAWGREALRVLRPGGHAVVFGGPRTFHRLTCGLEDAGFEVRDTLSWLFGSGFPKSLDVAKAIEASARNGRSRPEDLRRLAMGELYEPSGRGRVNYDHGAGSVMNGARVDVELGAQAMAWEGWGTALKPAWEPAVLLRKPLAGTVAQNVLAHGTGGLNIDGCRVGTGEGGDREGEPSAERRYSANGGTDYAMTPGPRGGDARGRWPANVVLDEEAAALLDAQTGERRPGGNLTGDEPSRPFDVAYGEMAGRLEWASYGDRGGPSRFYYTPKAARSEREAGLEDMEPARRSDGRAKDIEHPRLRTSARRNDHPTVKPVDLMRWLVRLVTPPGGVVLDPFLGSGSTGMAALDEGLRFIGVDKEPRYVEIARRRIAHRHLLEPELREPTAERPAGRLL